jgi:hypothetical protein
MADKPKRQGLAGLKRLRPSDVGRPMTKPKFPSFAGMQKILKDLKDATKKLSVHQEPRSKRSASLRSLMDQPRYKIPKSPHRDRKKSKYAKIFAKRKP